MNQKHSYSGNTSSSPNSIYEKEVKRSSSSSIKTPLTNWKVLSLLTLLLSLLLLINYLSVVIRFNNNLIFTAGAADKDKSLKTFDAIFFKEELGPANERMWLLKLFKLTLFSFLTEKILSFLFSFFNKKVNKILKEVISSRMQKVNVSIDEKSRQKQLEEKKTSEQVSSVIRLLGSFSALILELWFIWYSSLSKAIDNEVIWKISYIGFAIFSVYFLASFSVKSLLGNLEFYRDNENYKPLISESDKTIPKEGITLASFIQSSFTFFYFLLVVIAKDKTDNQKDRFSSARPSSSKMKGNVKQQTYDIGSYPYNDFGKFIVENYLFSMYLAGFINKSVDFWKDCLLFKKTFFKKSN